MLRPVKTSQSKSFSRVVPNKPQKIYCFLIILLSLLQFLKCMRDILKANMTKHAAYFAIADVYGSFLVWVCFTFTVWWKSDAFEELVNLYHQNIYQYVCCNNIKCKIKNNFSVSVLIFLLAIVSPITFFLGLAEKYQWNFTLLYNAHWTQAQDYFLLSAFDVGPYKVVLSAIYFFVLIYSVLLNTACKLLLIISAASLIQALNAVRHNLEEVTEIQGLEIYFLLKKTCATNNKAMGVTIFGFVFGCIPSLMYNIPAIIQPTGFFDFLWNLTGATSTFGFLIMAAIITKKGTEIFENWLTTEHNFLRLNEDNLSILLYELGGLHIAFSASGFIKLTLSFLGGVISLVLTFSVVLIDSDIVRN